LSILPTTHLRDKFKMLGSIDVVVKDQLLA